MTHRGLTGQAAVDCKRAERKSKAQVLENVINRVAARTEREILFQRRGLPSTIPAWASDLDATLPNLRTILKGRYLVALIGDEKHAAAHKEPRLYCPSCIARESCAPAY